MLIHYLQSILIAMFVNVGFSGEFWLGLHKIHSIVDQADYILCIELEDWKANTYYMDYSLIMGGPETDYAVHLTNVTGNIPSALPEQKEVKFSQKDHGNSTDGDASCPENYSGSYIPNTWIL